MQKLKFALLVLIGACSYGVLSSILKVGFQAGFSLSELLSGQYLFGWLGLLILILITRPKIFDKSSPYLLLVGVNLSTTGIFYGLSVQELPASIAVVLFFQFTWMGIIIEALYNKEFPSRDKLLSVAILFFGTLLAGGIFEGGIESLSIKGVVFGLLAALSFASYVFFNGRVGLKTNVYAKSFLMTSTAMLVISSLNPPKFLIDGGISAGIMSFIFPLALLGIVIPVIFFSIGIPKVGTGMGTILSAAELPAAIIASITIAKEVVTSLQWLGIIFILLGILLPQYLILREERKERKAFVINKDIQKI